MFSDGDVLGGLSSDLGNEDITSSFTEATTFLISK